MILLQHEINKKEYNMYMIYTMVKALIFDSIHSII